MNTKNTVRNNTLRMTCVMLAAVSTTMLAGVTQAAHAGDTPKQEVTYKDLNLNSDAGTKVLYKRIQVAADEVCGKVDVRDLQGMSVRKACLDRAISQAVAAVNSPMLTRVYFSKLGNPGPQPLPVAQIR